MFVLTAFGLSCLNCSFASFNCSGVGSVIPCAASDFLTTVVRLSSICTTYLCRSLFVVVAFCFLTAASYSSSVISTTGPTSAASAACGFLLFASTSSTGMASLLFIVFIIFLKNLRITLPSSYALNSSFESLPFPSESKVLKNFVNSTCSDVLRYPFPSRSNLLNIASYFSAFFLFSFTMLLL